MFHASKEHPSRGERAKSFLALQEHQYARKDYFRPIPPRFSVGILRRHGHGNRCVKVSCQSVSDTVPFGHHWNVCNPSQCCESIVWKVPAAAYKGLGLPGPNLLHDLLILFVFLLKVFYDRRCPSNRKSFRNQSKKDPQIGSHCTGSAKSE